MNLRTRRKLLMSKRVEVVGAPGFEPRTSCSQSRRATGLRHAPTLEIILRKTTEDLITRGFLDNRYLSHRADILQASPQFPTETHKRDPKRDHSARELLVRTGWTIGLLSHFPTSRTAEELDVYWDSLEPQWDTTGKEGPPEDTKRWQYWWQYSGRACVRDTGSSPQRDRTACKLPSIAGFPPISRAAKPDRRLIVGGPRSTRQRVAN